MEDTALEFVADEMTVVEGEGGQAEVCVRLLLLNNNTVLGYNITASVILSNESSASKSYIWHESTVGKVK